MHEGVYIGINTTGKGIENISEDYDKITITKNNLRDKKIKFYPKR